MVLAERFPVPVEGVDAGGVSLGFVFAVAAILLFGWQAGVIVAAGGPTVTHLDRPSPAAARRLQRLDVRARRACGGAHRRADPGELDRRAHRPARGRGVRLLLGRQPRPDQRGARSQRRQAVLQADLGQREADDGAVRAHDVGGPDARRPLGALACALDGARRPVARDRALPAVDVRGAEGDAPRADRPAHGPRQPPPLPRATAARARAGGAASRSRSRLCLVDIDDFKQINDRYGHPVGDRVLGQVAARLRQGGESFRLGGDEFAVLLPGLDPRDGVSVARSIVERVERGAARPDRLGDGERGRCDVPGAGRRPRRADPARRQRALLGEGRRKEPRAHLRARARRAQAAAAARGGNRPRGALPRSGEPREGRRRARRIHGQPLGAGRASSRRASPGASASRIRRSS